MRVRREWPVGGWERLGLGEVRGAGVVFERRWVLTKDTRALGLAMAIVLTEGVAAVTY